MYLKKINLKNKVALVTGAGKGIGRACAIALAEAGANLIIISRTKKDLDEVSKKIKKFKTKCKSYVCDITNYNDIKEIINKLPKLDILINNAGITGPTGPLWEYDVDIWNKIVQINLMGTFNCCRAIVPNMIKNNYGRIVNVASVAGKDGNANASAYSSGKAGAIGLTKALGKELADKDIAVNAVTPAGAKTRILNQMSKEHVQRMLSKVPRGRFLEIHEFTSLVCWLSSQENSFSTAAVFDISGGRSTY